MDDITTALITAERDTYGQIALELYHAYILLNLAVMAKEGYTFTYQVRLRYLREGEFGTSFTRSDQTIEGALAACLAEHDRTSWLKDAYPVAWYTTLTVSKGDWSRSIPVDPKYYRHLVPGGQFDSGYKSPDGTPILALAS